MKRTNRYWLYLVSALVDLALLVACYVGASCYYLGVLKGLEVPYHFRWNGLGVEVMTLYAALVVFCFVIAHVYGDTYYGRRERVALHIAAVNGVALLAFVALLYAVHIVNMSRMTLLIFYGLSTSVLIIKHWLTITRFERRRRAGRYQSSVLVIGSGHTACEYALAATEDPTCMAHIMGYVGRERTPDSAASPAEPLWSTHGEPHLDLSQADASYLGPRLGAIDDLPSVLDARDVDELIVALEPEEYPHMRQIMAEADKRGILLRMVPFYNDLLPRNPSIESVQSVKVLDMRSTPLDNAPSAALKRLFDILVSAFILVLISPILLITAIGVKLSSPGPILFRQERVGKNRKPFYMLKFRSMRVNAESATAWSTDTDPRKTKFGSFIRKYSIDELPQFVNVLKGDMSIVGPRPEIPHFVYEFQEEIPLYMLRHQVRPGITGWAQVNGLRGDTSIEKRVKYDLYYIENWSPWLDVRIFFRTIFGGFMNNEQVIK